MKCERIASGGRRKSKIRERILQEETEGRGVNDEL
jgi:hypothetical protein